LLRHFGRTRRTATEGQAIGGGKAFPVDEKAREKWLTALQEKTGLSRDRVSILLDRYGTRAEAVAEFMVEQPDQPLRHHSGYSRREIEFIIRYERVEHLDDLLLRRTAIAMLGELTGELLNELSSIVAADRRWTKEAADAEADRAVEILRDRFGVRIPRSVNGDARNPF
jgi:glycerol-3-phosphate dehydrogenase